MQIFNGYGWDTHQPLIHLSMNMFKPQFVLELGMGIYSTPIFVSYEPTELMCIENDKEWFEYMKSQCDSKNEYTAIFHDLGKDISSKTFLRQLTADQKVIISNYYTILSNQIKEKTISPKLLFVDHWTCCRTLSIDNLYESFDIIIYHDSQQSGIVWYEYYFDKNISKLFNFYTLKTHGVSTGCFISHKLPHTESELKNGIIPYINKYCDEHSINNDQVYLKKEY